MLSEERIKKMIRLSDYEAGMGDTDLRRTRYSKRDYVRLKQLRTVAGLVAATVLVLGMVFLYYIDSIPWKTYVSEGFFTIQRLLLIGGGLFVWLIIFAIAVLSTGQRSRREYEESSIRVNEYEQTLKELIQLYEEEEEGV